MLHDVINSLIGKVKFNNPPQERWLHQMRIKHTELCPHMQAYCLLVWDDGEINDKCRYAKVTKDNPEAMLCTHSGVTVGVKCVTSQAIDFILN